MVYKWCNTRVKENKLKITDEVFQIDGTDFSHAFLIRGEKNYLVDTGVPGLSEKILEKIRNIGVEPGEIAAILLTHNDIDHMGNAKKLKDATGAQVWAPAEDAGSVQGKAHRKGIKRLFEMFMKVQPVEVTGVYGDEFPFDEIKVIPAPGHTEGHTFFQYKNVVLAGDLLQCSKGKPTFVTSLLNLNFALAKKSVSKLNELDYEWICPAHGEPTKNTESFQKQLQELLK